MTFTWRQAAEIAKELQLKYQIPIFAMTFKGSCSCCAEPSNLNKEAYLKPDIKDKSWDEIESYVIFNNAHNTGGEADMDEQFSLTYDELFDEKRYQKQYIKYKLSDKFSKENLKQCLTEFVDAVNKETFATYKLSVPEDTGLCATIEKI
jgi:hypothetical protein